MKDLKDYLIDQVSDKHLSPEAAAIYLENLDKNPSSNIECAVVGMAGRFPKAETLEKLWENLLNQLDCVDNFPRSRMDDAIYVNSDSFEEYNGYNCRVGTYLDKVDLFDAKFFNLTPAESRVMDPAQRIFLQVAVEAIEDAGITFDELNESKTGVFVGYSVGDDNYIDLLSKDDPNVAIGNQPSMLAYRLSFLLNMLGPTMVVDTSCSSSLVAVHEAVKAIESGDCDQAIVGGVNVRIFPAIREIGNLGIEAYDGRCKTFDSSANGTNIGEGITAIVIKPKSDAEKNKNPIHCLIKGSAINSDGSSNGITAPNPVAQKQVILKAWENSKIYPEDLSFIETHGTGTKLGDPIEVMALSEAFQSFTKKKQFCPLGAVKTSIGHLEAASGMAGLIKAILCLKHKILPANLHYHQPNPLIDFDNSAVYPNSENCDLSNTDKKLLAGISSFGISGTNVHMVIEEFSSAEEPLDTPRSIEPVLFCISAKTQSSLRNNIKKHSLFLKNNHDVKLYDYAYTLARGRNHYPYRVIVVAQNFEEAVEKLSNLIEKDNLESQVDSGIYFSSPQDPLAILSHECKLSNLQKEVIQLFMNRQRIDWDKYFPQESGKKVSIPTYAFDQKRFWPKLQIKKTESVKDVMESIFFDLKWIKDPLIKSQRNGMKSSHNCLFLMHDSAEHEEFAKYCESQGVTLYKVYNGKQFEKMGNNCWKINPKNPAQYEKLLESLDEKKINGIVHLWGCLPSSKNTNYQKGILASQNLGAFSIFHLVNAFAKVSPNKNMHLACLTSHAYEVQEGEWVDPTRTPAIGICKVTSQEYPLIRSIGIDVDFANMTEEAKESLYSEIFQSIDYENGVVGYRANNRFVQCLKKKSLNDFPYHNEAIKEGGIYLIAGGAGYLGIQTTLVMARKKKIKAILVGRKANPIYTPQQKQSIKEIQRLGSEIFYVQSDVTDRSSCQSVIQYVKDEFKALDGVFVAVKNISHQRMNDVSFSDFSSNILAKIQATFYLDELTRDLKPDFMATFSSISSLTGGPTGADCCASNLFLDSFGNWRTNQGFPTYTMNFTLIEADDGSLLSDRMSMIPPLTKEEFQECLSMCISHGYPFSVMANFSSHVMKLVLPLMKIRFDEELIRKFSKSEKNSGDMSLSNTENFETPIHSDIDLPEAVRIMKEIWSEVLGHEEIEENANFFDIGGDSISAVKLLHLVKAQLQVELKISNLYSYPVLKDLCREIVSQSQSKDDSLDQIIGDLDSGKIDVKDAAAAFDKV